MTLQAAEEILISIATRPSGLLCMKSKKTVDVISADNMEAGKTPWLHLRVLGTHVKKEALEASTQRSLGVKENCLRLSA